MFLFSLCLCILNSFLINSICIFAYYSQSFRVSGESVKSAFAKPEQNTLILRDIAATATNEEIMAIFSGAPTASCPVPLAVRSDMNDTW